MFTRNLLHAPAATAVSAVVLTASVLVPAPGVDHTGTTTSERTSPTAVAGILTNDADPATRSVTSWGGNRRVAVDHLRSSVALDFSAPRLIRSVKLRDSDATSRVAADDYTVWHSNDNITYQRLTGWHLDESVVDGRLTHTFLGIDVTARFLKINSRFSDSGHTFTMRNLQADLVSSPVAIPDFGTMLHSDGDRMFPPGDLNCVEKSTPCGVDAAQARDIISNEVDILADAGFDTLKIGLGTDVLHWDSQVGSSRDWRLDDPDWALSPTTWSTYKDLRGRAYTARNMFAAGVDPIRVAAEQARANGLRVFLSYRIADTHFTSDPANYPLTSKFYLAREASADPANRVAISHSGASPVPGFQRFDTLMNFDKAAVRQQRLAEISEALDRYDGIIDGFEIDFSRSTALFPLGVGRSRTSVVSRFVQDVRSKMDTLETDTKRLYLSMRVPPSQDVAIQQGLDVTELIRDRAMDIVVPSNVMTVVHDMEIRPWLAAAAPESSQDDGVAVYAGLPQRKASGWNFPKTNDDPSAYTTLGVAVENEQVLGAALVYDAMGADGIELYNFAGLVANSKGRAQLAWLATHLAPDANVDGLDRIFAVSNVHADPYEGRFEHAKPLPAQFRSDGSLWVNAADGTLVKRDGNEYVAPAYITGSPGSSNDTWLLRVGIRAIPDQPLDLTKLSLQITMNGDDILWDGPIYASPTATLVRVPRDPVAAPAPTHYITIPIPSGFPLNDNDVWNTIGIRQNAAPGGPFGFAVQEIQIGAFAPTPVVLDKRLPSAGGLRNSDTNPVTGALPAFGSTGSVALDYQRRSVGADLFGLETVRRVELVDRDDASRLTAADYTLWVSNDNVTYEQVVGWNWSAEVVDGQLVHTFDGFETSARYVKLNTRYDDAAFTFVLANLTQDIRVYADSPNPGVPATKP